MQSQEHLNTILKYDETSPSGLRWNIYKGSSAQIGFVAGSIYKSNNYTYYRIKINNKSYKVHNIIWKMKTGGRYIRWLCHRPH